MSANTIFSFMPHGGNIIDDEMRSLSRWRRRQVKGLVWTRNGCSDRTFNNITVPPTWKTETDQSSPSRPTVLEMAVVWTLNNLLCLFMLEMPRKNRGIEKDPPSGTKHAFLLLLLLLLLLLQATVLLCRLHFQAITHRRGWQTDARRPDFAFSLQLFRFANLVPYVAISLIWCCP